MRELMILLCIPFQQIIAHVVVTVPQKEHKVHNIVLYPDKHSWCKTTPIKQIITHPGCRSQEIDNNVCVGACFSYSIPKTKPDTPGDDVLPYCDSCQPSQTKWIQITLESEDEEDSAVIKSVEMINSCVCASCVDPNSKSSHGIPEATRGTSNPDVPELMSLMMETHNTRVHSPDSEVTELTTERVAVEVKRVDEAEPLIDLEALQVIRSKLERQDHKIDDLSLSNFLEKIKSEHDVGGNSEKLKSVLSNSDQTHNRSRHHRVPGPHHSMIYPTYSLDIAADLNENLKVKPSLEAPAGTDDVISYHQDDNESPNSNLISTAPEEKLTLNKKLSFNMS